MVLIIYFVSLIYYSFAVETQDTQESNQYYRISMVSSHENPGSPALFVHGESPVWDAELQSLYFVDARENNVHRLDYVSGKIYTKHIDYGEVNVVSLVTGSHRLLVAVRSSLFLLDWGVAGDAALRLLTTVDMGQPDNVINEGKADAEGRFWAGTKGPQTGDDVLPDKATFYSIEQESFTKPRIQLRPVSVSNGVAWSLNNTVMYYIDSATQKIDAFDFDLQRGDLSGRRTILDITGYGYEDALPCGMTIDSRGNLWIALMFGGTILHVDPDARSIVFGYKLPVSRVTSVCWGGPNLDELFVTTARDNLDATLEPLGGAIFTIRGTGSRGVHYLLSDKYNIFEYTNLTFTHAESPAWDPATHTLYWVDVLNQDVHALHYFTKKHKVKHINYGEVNIVQPVRNSSRVLVGVRNELFLMDWDKAGDSALRFVAAFDQGLPENILNEGQIDALGRFWGGTKGRQRGDQVASDEGALYSLEAPHFMPRVQLKPVSISNGLVWSLNNSVLYYIDSRTRKIDAFDFKLKKGQITHRRTILDIGDYWEEKVIADGMTIDKDGFLWIAMMFHGCIVRIDPDRREIVERYKLPVTLVTSMTWAGRNLDDLIVTTSRRNMKPEQIAKEPLAGSIFVLHKMGTSGAPNHKFNFPDADDY
ncbi:unnamed protein product [Chrysodeixis includens]|uniref:SMP-30/Gluconolactonase/LRE-like region domain-containing protein n=1 Tax=Chrysodeixis includens TaxID=689277 RepID=A0A9N8KXZ5_CHRIL|nr:unnamed protein product [Chrysodeixis includens]